MKTFFDNEYSTSIGTLCTVLIGLVIFIALWGSWTIIDTGERGVVLRLGRYAETMDEGLNFKTPLVDKVVKLNIRDVNLTVDTEVSSGDMQTIKVQTSLIYALEPNSVGRIYQKYNVNYENILIKPLLLESINSVVANYPIESFVEKRSEISERIKSTFITKAGHDGIVVKSLMITEHDFSDEFNRAIENKKIAEQGALKAKYDLERVTLEAKAQMEKQKSLNAMVLQEKAIDKWDGKLPQYYSGGELPFILSK
jgi:regulator of protease activity HflC (stomatin/prohibitin superfamily)